MPRKVLVTRTHGDGDGELCGLEGIVASSGNEAAADEGCGGERVDGCELTDGVEQEDRAGGDGLRGLEPGGTEDERDAAFTQELCDLGETLGMAGREDGDDAGRAGVEEEFFFAGESRAANEDGRCRGKIFAESAQEWALVRMCGCRT